MKKQITAVAIASSLAFGQQAAKPAPGAAAAKPAAAAPAKALTATPAKPAAPAAAKPAAPKPATALKPAIKPAIASGVDTVIQLVKSGLTEGMILRTLKTAGKVYSLTPPDMLKLTQAGVSENIMNMMMDPKGEVAAAAPAPAAAPSVSPPDSAPVVNASATPAAPPKVEKRRLAITPFDYSAVKNWVTYWFKNDVNIGQGIRANLTTRVAKNKNIRLVEREKVDNIMKEQDFGATARVAGASRAKIGKILGADAILYGDIVIFGRDDKQKKEGVWAGLTRFGTGINVTKFKKEEKVVVGINYRIVDAETGEILDTGEARGESKRESKDWGALMGQRGVGVGGVGGGMESSNFGDTIIGEATLDACDKLAEQIGKKIPELPIKPRIIDAMVASVQGDKVYINFGTNEGVQSGDHFEVHRITGLVKDPDTKEVLDKQTELIGKLTITQVREKISLGSYSGPALTASQMTGFGYAARKVE